MSDTGRCLQDEIEFVTLKDDPLYMGCFEDVLQLVSARCSGQPDCEIRIPDPEMEKTNPCYRHLAKYLEVTYHCIRGMNLQRYIFQDFYFGGVSWISWVQYFS